MKKYPEHCASCATGRYLQIERDYPIDFPEGDSTTVPHLLVLKCDTCDDEIIPPDSSARIDATIDKHQDTLQPEAVREFLKQFNVDQTEAAEALGLGSKTFHRWARGTQRVSRSMGYMLRALSAYPMVFHWIKERRWK